MIKNILIRLGFLPEQDKQQVQLSTVEQFMKAIEIYRREGLSKEQIRDYFMHILNYSDKISERKQEQKEKKLGIIRKYH